MNEIPEKDLGLFLQLMSSGLCFLNALLKVFENEAIIQPAHVNICISQYCRVRLDAVHHRHKKCQMLSPRFYYLHVVFFKSTFLFSWCKL